MIFVGIILGFIVLAVLAGIWLKKSKPKKEEGSFPFTSGGDTAAPSNEKLVIPDKGMNSFKSPNTYAI